MSWASGGCDNILHVKKTVEIGKSSDRDGNKAVVLLNISLQDVRAGTQDSLEPRPVQFDTLEGSACNNSGSTGPVHQQGDLTWATQKRQTVKQGV